MRDADNPLCPRLMKLELFGIVALEDRRPAGFYAARRVERSLIKRCARFVKAEVLPHLNAVPPDLRFFREHQLKIAIPRFLSARRLATGKSPLMIVDWAGDAHLLEPLLGLTVPIVVASPPTPMRWAIESYFSAKCLRHNAMIDATAFCHAFQSFNALKYLDKCLWPIFMGSTTRRDCQPARHGVR